MKRIFTLLCALLLLLTSFSGMVVSAAEVDAAQEAVALEAPAAEEETDSQIPADVEMQTPGIPANVEMKTPDMFANAAAAPATYAASGDQDDDFLAYLKEQIALCKSTISIEKFAYPSNDFAVNLLMYSIWYEMPELFHCYRLGVSTDGEILIDLYVEYRPFADTVGEYVLCLDRMKQSAEYLLRDVKGNDNLSQVEKALILHDRLAVWTNYARFIYDDPGYASGRPQIYTAYGALFDKQAVCQGYTLAYMYLLAQVGIESDFCSSAKLNHAWNIVYIEGEPYYTDVTWDDPIISDENYYDVWGQVYHDSFLRSYNGIRSTGHNASDFAMVNAPTLFDSGWFWEDTIAAVELVGDEVYYLDNYKGKVWRVDDSGYTCIYEMTPYNLGKLASANGKLLVSREKDVISVDPATGSWSVIFAPEEAQSNNAYIEGMMYRTNNIWIQIHKGYALIGETLPYQEIGTGITITQHPKNVMAPKGSTAKVTVKAQGEGLRYSWAVKYPKDGGFTEINTVGDTFSLKMSSANDGTQVRCTISDIYGNWVITDVVTLRMGNPATITTQPKNTVVSKGSTAKVTVKATGDGITYTWYAKKKNDAAFSKTSVTTDTYSVKMTDALNGCQVYCVVTDFYGNQVESSVVTLYVGTPVKITTQPKNVTVPKGSNAKVSVKASGSSLKYAWYYMKKGESKYTKTSATKNEFSAKMDSGWNGAKVYCVVTDQFGVSVKSSVVTLKMGNVAKITTQPSNAVASSGKTVKVTIKATGDGLTYTWYYAKKGSSKYTKVSGSKSSYSVKMSSSVNGRQVYCVVKDKYGNSVKSKVVTLYKGTPAKIKTQPKNVAAFNGKTAKFTVKASGSSLKYEWYYMKKGATKYTKASATKKDYSVKMSASWDGAKVYCVVKDKYGTSVKSKVVTLSLAKKATITTQPKNVTVEKNKTAKVSVKATGDGLSYTWYYAKKGSSKFKKTSVKSATYSVKMTSSVNGRKVYCIVKDQYGNKVKSKVVTLSMFDPIAVVAGSYKSTHLYIPDGYLLKETGLSMTITTAGKVTMKAKSAGGTESATYKLKYLGKEDGNPVYSVYNSKETVTLYYDSSEKEAYIETDGGYVFIMKRK